MMVSILLLSIISVVLAAALIISGLYVRSRLNKIRFENKELLSQTDSLVAQNESLKNSLNNFINERDNYILKELDKIRNLVNNECSLKQQQFETTKKEEYENKKKAIEASCEKKIKDIQADCSNKIKLMERDLDEACEEQITTFKKRIDDIDDLLGKKIDDIKRTNTMYFTCVCDKTKEIPCEIDLSTDENYFSCPNCGAVWRVDINAYPVLISNVSSNTTLASIMDGYEEYEIPDTVHGIEEEGYNDEL